MDLQREIFCEPFPVFFQKFVCKNLTISQHIEPPINKTGILAKGVNLLLLDKFMT